MLLLVLFCFSSCIADSIKDLDGTENTGNSEIVVLDFAEGSAALRGMTKFPDDIPFNDTKYGKEESFGMTYGFWISCGIMRSLPVIPSITSVNTDVKTYVKSFENKKLYGFGFPLGVEDAYVTEDGIYIRYSIEEDDRKVGQIEYYYSIKARKFSYREIVSPMLGSKGGDNIIVFELFDVPVTKGIKGLSFKVGELYDNGSVFNFYDVLCTVNQELENSEKVRSVSLVQLEMHMKYDSNTVDAARLGERTINDIPLGQEFDISDRKNSLNYDESIDLLQILFDGRLFSDNQKIRTIDDFNATAIKLKDFDNYEHINRDVIYYPSSFNLKKKKAASVMNSDVTYDRLQFSFPDVAVKAFRDC